ncbi:hypothetical protein DPEC_G00233740 [Dallia pectoralis]|uniref:Uncharacterized protein n=1 Tax=Dallia pectoralis TaxID=75939 RepID=A0ACC2FXN2_DALPE|nr:hypothetical protein DPEC_G00233740 [Dallia pectoralis]
MRDGGLERRTKDDEVRVRCLIPAHETPLLTHPTEFFALNGRCTAVLHSIPQWPTHSSSSLASFMFL